MLIDNIFLLNLAFDQASLLICGEKLGGLYGTELIFKHIVIFL